VILNTETNATLNLIVAVMGVADQLAIGLGQLSVTFKIHGLMTLRKGVDVCQQLQQVI